MFFLLQSPQTLWNFALGANILGTILFFFVARNDSYSALTLFINFLCCISNLLWAKMFADLQRNQRTIYFFIGLCVGYDWYDICMASASRRIRRRRIHYEYYSEDEGESEPKAGKEKKKLK